MRPTWSNSTRCAPTRPSSRPMSRIRPTRVCSPKGWPSSPRRCGPSRPRSGPAHALSGPHPIGASARPSGRGVAAPAQWRRQRRGAGPHRRVGHHRRGVHQRRPGRGHKTPAERCAGPGTEPRAGPGALVAELERTISVLETVVVQTRTRLGGQVPDGSTRIVSLHDTDARPIAKGRLGRPVEFGFKAQVTDNADGIVLDHLVGDGQPARRSHARGRHRPHQEKVLQGAQIRCHRGSGLWRGQGGDRAPRARRHPRRHPAQGTPRCSTPSGRVIASLPQSWSSGAPDQKDASRTSSTPGAGNAPCSTASTGRAHGAAGVSSRTTPPRSPCSSTSANRTRNSLLLRGNQREPPPDHQDAPRHRLTVCLSDLASTLSLRVPAAANGRKRGSKASGEVGGGLMGARGGHPGQLENRTGSTFSGRSN